VALSVCYYNVCCRLHIIKFNICIYPHMYNQIDIGKMCVGGFTVYSKGIQEFGGKCSCIVRTLHLDETGCSSLYSTWFCLWVRNSYLSLAPQVPVKQENGQTRKPLWKKWYEKNIFKPWSSISVKQLQWGCRNALPPVNLHTKLKSK
jgi:hypothetical protein